jgi:alpha-L-arabinofuranosidase
VVNVSTSAKEVSINLAGAGKPGKAGKAFVLTAAELTAENSLNDPAKVAPVERQFAVPSNQFTYALAANSLTVLRIPGV